MSITTAIGDLLHSFYELFISIVGTFYNIITGFLMAIVHFFTGILQMVGDILGGFVDVAGGIGKFALSNIVVLGILAAGVFAYLNFSRQQGRTAPVKKTN